MNPVLFCRWQRTSEGLTDWSHKLESHLPGKLSELVHWLVMAESSMHSGVNLSKIEPTETLTSLDSLIKKHEVAHSRAILPIYPCRFLQTLLAQYPAMYSAFYHIYRSGRVEGKRIPPEFLDPIHSRYKSVHDQAPEHLKWLKFLQAQYRYSFFLINKLLPTFFPAFFPQLISGIEK